VRRFWHSPALRGGAQLALQVGLAAALFVVLQLLVGRHNVRFDLTPTHAFALSATARQVAESIDKPVRITVFYNSQQGDQRRNTADLLDQFATAAPNLQYRLLDLDRSPALANKYGISSYNTGVVEMGDEVLPLRSIDEGEITSVLLSLSRTHPRGVCFVTGHGERDPQNADERSGYSELGKALERERFTVQSLRTVPADGVPPACTVVVLGGPSHDFAPGEADALRRYLDGGGRVLLLVDPDAPRSVLQFLAGFGIDARPDLIVDQQNRFVGADAFMPQVADFRTDIFRNRLTAPAVLSLARPIGRTETMPDGVQVISVARSGPDTWAMVNTAQPPDGEVRFRRDVDEVGPFSVGALATVKASQPNRPAGQLMVFGDSDFASNFYLDLLGNRDLILSSIAYLAEDPTLVAVRRKGRPVGTLSPITLTAAQSRAIFWAAVLILPGVCLLVGGSMGLRRLRHRGGR
jgi:gliding motility-associatede transport system auxiliary component